MDILLALLLSFFATFLPTVIFVGIAWWLDRYEKEPVWLLTITFLWGAVPAIIVSLVIELILDIPLQVFVTGEGRVGLINTVVVAPIVEEMAKAVPLLCIFLLRRKEFDGLMDGLIYGALVGLGFALTENLFYFLNAYAVGGWTDWGTVVFGRAIIFGLNHALFTSAFGAGLGYARYAERRSIRRVAPFLGLLGGILLHLVHNLFVSIPGAAYFCLISLLTNWLGLISWLTLMFIATQAEKRWITEELQDEVIDGLLPSEHAEAAARYRTRLAERWAAFREHGFGHAHRLSLLHHAAAELAIKKRQLHLHGDEDGNAAEIARLRERIVQLLREIELVKVE